MFFALKGDNFNGNQYAKSALEAGACYAVVDESEFALNDSQYLLVDNVLNCLQTLARYHRLQLGIPILGITGTNGKTTSKELIYTVLSKKYRTVATKGNLNNHIGVPLTLLSMDKNTELGIVEMGANHIGDIAELCQIALPSHGVITNIGTAHLLGFGSFEGVVQTKSELYQYLIKNAGVVFYNADNEILSRLLKDESVIKISYGKSDKYNSFASFGDANPFLSLHFPVISEKVQTHLLGAYNFENVLAAKCIGEYFKVEEILIKEAIEGYIPSNNRSQLIEKECNKVWADCYNANPSSMKAAIENIAQADANRNNQLLILGDMFELGETSTMQHDALVKLIVDKGFVNVVLTGAEFKKTKPVSYFNYFNSAEEVVNYLKIKSFKGFTILVKGSRGMKLEQVLEVL
jgi:UDP-N-acetylmuramoyl-tripeptide--D-alanyl-D-alanine ligase